MAEEKVVEEKKSGGNPMMLVLIVLIVLLLAAVGGGGYLLYSKGDFDDKPKVEESAKQAEVADDAKEISEKHLKQRLIILF